MDFQRLDFAQFTRGAYAVKRLAAEPHERGVGFRKVKAVRGPVPGCGVLRRFGVHAQSRVGACGADDEPDKIWQRGSLVGQLRIYYTLR